jgi:acetyltransferase
MQQLIYYADAEGLADLHGNILAANTRMLQMCRDLGFEINADPEDQLLFRVTLKFPSAAEACRTLGSHRG